MEYLALTPKHHLAPGLERILTSHRTALEELFSAQLDAALHHSVTGLNQLLRRLKSAQSPEDVARWLIDATEGFCGRAALFEVTGAGIASLLVRGRQAPRLELTLQQAPAFAHAIQERDTVIAIGSPGEVSAEAAELLGHQASQRVCLVPLVVKRGVAGILYAAPDEAPVEVAALELLVQVAGWYVETLADAEIAPASEPVAGELVSIRGIDLNAYKTKPAANNEERQLHALARRFGRAEAARLRLYRRDAVQRGRAAGDLYGVLREEIDVLRQSFQQEFVAKSATMTDYFHRELLRSLAHGKAELLGPDYPGPLA